MTVFRSLLLAAAFTVSTGSAALAQDYDKGVAAYNSGDYATALQEWRALAEQGNAVGQPYAQSNLGVLYEFGKGVLQNNTKAHMWFNIAAANGYEDAGKWRDDIAEKMTPADISKAQSMAATCMESGYKDCGG